MDSYKYAPIYENNELDGCIATFTDVTYKKRFEQKLSQSEEQYRQIINSTDQGFIMLDANYNIQEANEAFVKLLNCDSQEILGKSLIHFLDEKSQKEFSEKYELLKGQRGVVYHFNISNKKGESVPVIFNETKRFNENKEVICSFGFFQDLSDLLAFKN